MALIGENPYNEMAWLYAKHWGTYFSDKIFPILQERVSNALEQGSCIIDIGCGTGALVRMMKQQGFNTIGLDISSKMIEFASKADPAGQYLCRDVVSCEDQFQVDACLSNYDTLNNILHEEELLKAFRRIYSWLKPYGIFWFDICDPEKYLREWNNTSTVMSQNDHVALIDSTYDEATALARLHVVVFRPSSKSMWTRSEFEILERAYSPSTIEPLLRSAGFSIDYIINGISLGIDRGPGRNFFKVRRPIL